MDEMIVSEIFLEKTKTKMQVTILFDSSYKRAADHIAYSHPVS